MSISYQMFFVTWGFCIRPQQLGRVPATACVCYSSIWVAAAWGIAASHFVRVPPEPNPVTVDVRTRGKRNCHRVENGSMPREAELASAVDHPLTVRAATDGGGGTDQRAVVRAFRSVSSKPL